MVQPIAAWPNRILNLLCALRRGFGTGTLHILPLNLTAEGGGLYFLHFRGEEAKAGQDEGLHQDYLS